MWVCACVCIISCMCYTCTQIIFHVDATYNKIRQGHPVAPWRFIAVFGRAGVYPFARKYKRQLLCACVCWQFGTQSSDTAPPTASSKHHNTSITPRRHRSSTRPAYTQQSENDNVASIMCALPVSGKRRCIYSTAVGLYAYVMLFFRRFASSTVVVVRDLG